MKSAINACVADIYGTFVVFIFYNMNVIKTVHPSPKILQYNEQS